jgi:hypothetical protein
VALLTHKPLKTIGVGSLDGFPTNKNKIQGKRMTRYVIVDTSTNRVWSIQDSDTDPGNPPFGLPDNFISVQNDTAQYDWIWNGSTLVAPPLATWQLYTYMLQKQSALSCYAITVDGNQISIPATAEVIATINASVLRLQQPNPPASISIHYGMYDVVTLQATDLMALFVGLYDVSQAVLVNLKAVSEGIAAGTITTYAQIDSIYAQ